MVQIYDKKRLKNSINEKKKKEKPLQTFRLQRLNSYY